MRSKKFEDTFNSCLYLSECYELEETIDEIKTIITKYYSFISDEDDYQRIYEIEKELKRKR